MFFASVFNFIPEILQKKKEENKGKMHFPSSSLHGSWPPCNILSISLCNAQLRNLLHQREEKPSPPLASLFSQGARWNFSGVTPADYSRVMFHTYTYLLSLSLSHFLSFFLSLFSSLYISFFHYYCESCVRVLVRGSGRLACIREIRRDNVVSEIVWWLYIVNTME